MIDSKLLDSIAEKVAQEVIDIIGAMGLKPSKAAGGGERAEQGRLPDDVILQIYDTMPQQIKDYLRGHWGDEVWTAYEADIEKIRGG